MLIMAEKMIAIAIVDVYAVARCILPGNYLQSEDDADET